MDINAAAEKMRAVKQSARTIPQVVSAAKYEKLFWAAVKRYSSDWRAHLKSDAWFSFWFAIACGVGIIVVLVMTHFKELGR